MSDAWYPAAVRDPGDAAGYAHGHTTMSSVVCHFTVGRDSTSIGRRGYFNFLVARDGRITQFAEANAVCWHAGDPWNGRGPGIEVEYLPGVDDEIFTPEAWKACGGLNSWLVDEWDVTPMFYDGDRVGSWDGFITHRSLIQTGDWHYDYWPDLPLAIAPGPTPSPIQIGADDMWIAWCDETGSKNYGKAAMVGGAHILGELGGPPNQFGIPSFAAGYKADHPEVALLPVGSDIWDRMEQITIAGHI